jgi:hypothetical protein
VAGTCAFAALGSLRPRQAVTSGVLSERLAALTAHIRGQVCAEAMQEHRVLMPSGRAQVCGREVKVPDIHLQLGEAAIKGGDCQIHDAILQLLEAVHFSSPPVLQTSPFHSSA